MWWVEGGFGRLDGNDAGLVSEHESRRPPEPLVGAEGPTSGHGPMEGRGGGYGSVSVSVGEGEPQADKPNPLDLVINCFLFVWFIAGECQTVVIILCACFLSWAFSAHVPGR